MKDKDYEQLATKIMINALEGVKAQIRKAYNKGYEDRKAEESESARAIVNTEQQKSYEDGLNDAWEVIKKITKDECTGGYSIEMMQELFGQTCVYDITHNYTPEEALAKIKAYEDKQKQDAEIKVGDEVYSDAFDDKGIVTHITTDQVSCVCIICNGFTMMKVGLCGLHKTGRTFPQIAKVLAELRGAENDEQ